MSLSNALTFATTRRFQLTKKTTSRKSLSTSLKLSPMRMVTFPQLRLCPPRSRTYCANLMFSSGLASVLESRKPIGSRSRSRNWLLQSPTSLSASSVRFTALRQTTTSLRLRERSLKTTKPLKLVTATRVRLTPSLRPAALVSMN